MVNETAVKTEALGYGIGGHMVVDKLTFKDGTTQLKCRECGETGANDSELHSKSHGGRR